MSEECTEQCPRLFVFRGQQEIHATAVEGLLLIGGRFMTADAGTEEFLRQHEGQPLADVVRSTVSARAAHMRAELIDLAERIDEIAPHPLGAPSEEELCRQCPGPRVTGAPALGIPYQRQCASPAIGDEERKDYGTINP